MTPKEFCNWLEGYLECTHASKPLQCHIDAIYAKLKTVAEPAKLPVMRTSDPKPFITEQFPPPQIPYATGTPPIQPPFEVNCGDIVGSAGPDWDSYWKTY